MTLPRSETPLRRSAVGSYRESMVRDITVINDDEAERQEARRRTLQQQRMRESTVAESIEENETIRQCLEIYNGNKLSRDNAWSLSLIDTLSNLLSRHHKSLSNFKMAGSSLEVSSKVYGLRVDSIYLDALRMSAGLNARKVTEQQLNAAADDDDGADRADPADGTDADKQAQGAVPKPKKRARKAVSTVTKNKETLNARLDTAPLQDPVFGKLNSTVGSINASNRLMHNILPTKDSELRLCTTYRFWDESDLPNDVTDYTIAECADFYEPHEVVSAEWALKLLQCEKQLVLRPMYTGYIITDAPIPTNSGPPKSPAPLSVGEGGDDDDDHGHHDNGEFFENPKELSMVFDVNADCEPIPDLNVKAAVLDVDFNDLEELTTEEQRALNRCRGLRKKPHVIDDLRPVDGTSKLEYSYRPMDKISQFWAGPSHWKFKRGRTTFGQTNTQTSTAATGTNTQRVRRPQQQAKRRSQKLNFGQCHDELFQAIETTGKLRKANFQKKWDPRKLTLPTKYSFESNFFYKYEYAPSIKVTRRFGKADTDTESGDEDELGHHTDAPDDAELFDNEHFMPGTPNFESDQGLNVGSSNPDLLDGDGGDEVTGEFGSGNGTGNDMVLEIATEYDNAPTKVTKVVVPFAKRAKVIDMKNLKRSCNSLIQKQLLNEVPEESLPVHPTVDAEHYEKGAASFNDLYAHLPKLLTTKMADSLSPSVALYAVLHLANDLKLRLIPQDDLADFKIRQVKDD